MDQRDRLRRNAESKATAEHDGETWTHEQLEWLQSWTPGDEAYLAELAELLGRTIEACREQFYKRRRAGSWEVVVEITITNRTVYRGWMEGDGDGW